MNLDLFTRDDPRWVAVREEAKIAVAVLTLKDFAYRCDASPSGIADALAERDQKRLAARHLVTLIDTAPPANQLALLQTIAAPAGYRVERVVPLTVEEENKKLKKLIADLAPGLLPAMERALKP